MTNSTVALSISQKAADTTIIATTIVIIVLCFVLVALVCLYKRRRVTQTKALRDTVRMKELPDQTPLVTFQATGTPERKRRRRKKRPDGDGAMDPASPRRDGTGPMNDAGPYDALCSDTGRQTSVETRLNRQYTPPPLASATSDVRVTFAPTVDGPAGGQRPSSCRGSMASVAEEESHEEDDDSPRVAIPVNGGELASTARPAAIEEENNDQADEDEDEEDEENEEDEESDEAAAGGESEAGDATARAVASVRGASGPPSTVRRFEQLAPKGSEKFRRVSTPPQPALLPPPPTHEHGKQSTEYTDAASSQAMLGIGSVIAAPAAAPATRAVMTRTYRPKGAAAVDPAPAPPSPLLSPRCDGGGLNTSMGYQSGDTTQSL